MFVFSFGLLVFVDLRCPDRFNGPMPPSCAIHPHAMQTKSNLLDKGRIKTFYKLNDIEGLLAPLTHLSHVLPITWCLYFVRSNNFLVAALSLMEGFNPRLAKIMRLSSLALVSIVPVYIAQLRTNA